MSDANPVAVSITPDLTRSARAAIGPQGGTVETTNAVGSRYTLTVPANALENVQAVRLTPVSIEGLPFSDPATAGVAIEPDGVQLLEPGTLEVAGPGAGGQAFTFHGPGHDLARWIVTDTDTSVVPVVGFAGFGLAPDTTGPADWRPGDPATRSVHDLAFTFYGDTGTLAQAGGIPIAQGLTDDQKVVDTLCAAARQRFERAVAMQPQALADPIGVGPLVIGELISAGQLTGGICTEQIDADLHAIAQILEAAARELSRRCETKTHDPVLTFRRAIRLVRQAQLLGIGGEDYSAILAALTGVRTCTSYQLYAQSTVVLRMVFHQHVDGGDQFEVEGTVFSDRFQMELKILDNKSVWHVRMPLQIRNERWEHDCWTGQPFRLVGDLAEAPAWLDVRAEPIYDYERVVDFNGRVLVSDDSGSMSVSMEMNGYALMPAKESGACDGLNPLLWDVGGSFLGAWGTFPFKVHVAGEVAHQADAGEAFLTPPGTDTVVLSGHHATMDAAHEFTTDSAGQTLDFEVLFESAESPVPD